jgi:SH3-like domain-containing protein
VQVAADAPTPNHDPHHQVLMRTATAEAPAAETPETKPIVAAAAAPTFVAAKNALYAKANARLRAAPSTAGDVVAKLPANAPLRVLARSTDGAWWQVALADGRTGYVHRDAAAEVRATTRLPSTTAAVAVATRQPAPAGRSQGSLAFMSEAMNWLADKAGTTGTGAPSGPKVVRTER